MGMTEFVHSYYMKALLVIVVLSAYWVCTLVVSKAIGRLAASKEVGCYRTRYISKTINIVLLPVFLIVLTLLLGIEYSQITVFLSSLFAVIGVAMFAQWSILSNITASLVIFFSFPYRVGDSVKVVDKDDDISGVIDEISLFHVIIKKSDGNIVTYPNNLILQKAVIKMLVPPRDTKTARKFLAKTGVHNRSR